MEIPERRIAGHEPVIVEPVQMLGGHATSSRINAPRDPVERRRKVKKPMIGFGAVLEPKPKPKRKIQTRRRA